MSAELEVVAEYPSGQPVEEQRRAFILSHLASAEIDGQILVENCGLLEKWIENGVIPAKTRKKLEAVK